MSDNHEDARARVEALERELADDPRSLGFVTLAESHVRLEQFDAAVAVAQKGLAYHPDSVTGRVILAEAEAGRSNIKQALEQLKRALLIDQENAQALALMGRILLTKGLARRAVQFASHAVRNAPDVPEYADLLRRAKKAAQNEPPPSVFRAEQVRDAGSPWTADDQSDSEFDARAPEAEHTVFDPDALKKLKAGKDAKAKDKDAPRTSQRSQELEEALKNLPSATDETADAEPTRFDGRARRATIALPTELPPPRRVDVERVDPREEPTSYDAKNPLNEPRRVDPKKKPMVGGSAAELSKMIRRSKDGSVRDLAEEDEAKLGASPTPEAASESATSHGRPRPPAPTPPPAPKLPGDSAIASHEEEATPYASESPSRRIKAAAADLEEATKPPKEPTRAKAPSDPKPEPVRERVSEEPAPKEAEKASSPAKEPSIDKAPPAKEPSAAKPATKEPTPAKEPAKEPAAAKEPEKVEKVEKEKTTAKPPPAAKDPSVDKGAKDEKPAKDAEKKEPAKAKEAKPSLKPDAAKPEAAKAEPAKAEGAKEVEPNKQIGPASTRMVDEALWALLGGKVESPEAKPVVPIERDKKAPEKPADKEKEKPAAAAKEPKKDEHEKKGAPAKGAEKGPRVVRTSERFGLVLEIAVLLVLAGSFVWIGYAAGLSRAGPPPEVASEEVKGIATDLEKGSLAALLAAEEKVQVLAPSMPQLSDLLGGVLAEIYARRWASFGRDPELKVKAREKIASLDKSPPTVELLAAKVTLSTSAADRAALDQQLAQTIAEYPESPKAWVLRARLAMADGKSDVVETALYTARALNPQHRATLLDLARWHATNGAYAAAFGYYEQLQTAFPDDVEVALDRYVLGQITGRDPNEAQAAATLAGLVRQELASVAKDEAGRVSLAFAVNRFARGELQAGIDELAKADAAYKRSAEMKATLAGVYLAAGEWERARTHYAAALELDPENVEHRLGIAHATFGERAGLRADPEQVKRAARDAKKPSELEASNRASGSASGSVTGSGVVLPFGTLRFQLGRFSLVTVEPAKDVFPEAAYAVARATAKGPALQKALEAASIVAIASEKVRAGAIDDALTLLEEASKLSDDANVRVAFGRAYQAKKDVASATRAFKKAIELDPNSVAARVGLASILAEDNQAVAAIELLEKLEKSDVMVPQALVLLGRLRLVRGDYEGALGPLETIAELSPGDVSALLALGEAQHRTKHQEQALETFKKVVKTGKVPEKLTPVQALYVGRLEIDKNEKRGLALLTSSAEHEDAPEEAHFYLGRYLVKKPKTKKQGKKELQTFLKLVSSGELAEEAERLIR